MTEVEFNSLIVKVGYLETALRGWLVACFFIAGPRVRKSPVITPLFWWAAGIFLISVLELAFITAVNTYPDFFVPYLDRFNIHNTFFTSPLFYLTGILGLGIFFSRAIGGSTGKFVFVVSFTLAVAEILNSLFGEGFREAQKIGSAGMALFKIILCVLFFRKNFIKGVDKSLKDDALNLIVWGVFSISSLTILVLIFSNSLYSGFTILFYQISLGRMIIEMLGILLIGYGVRKFRIR